MQKLGPADYRVMPWKNGGGSTTELLIHPPGATLDGGFLWRVSQADVAASGPFSRFPELDHGEHGRQRLEGPFQPVSFSGDWTTTGTLLDGPCRDFNVMSARGKVRHTLEVLTVDGSIELPDAGSLLVVCLCGSVELRDLPLAEGEMAELEGSPGLLARGRAVLALVRLHALIISARTPTDGSEM